MKPDTLTYSRGIGAGIIHERKRPSLAACFKHLYSFQPVISVSDIATPSGVLTVAHEIRRCALWCGYTVHTKTHTADHGTCTRTRTQVINILRDAHTRNLA